MTSIKCIVEISKKHAAEYLPNRTLFSIFITMNNLGLKLCKEIGHVSVRVQELFNAPEEEFKNEEKAKWYYVSKGYHKKQHGLIKVSKYIFLGSEHNLEIPLSKHGIIIHTETKGYDYAKTKDDNIKIWYINYAEEKVFCNRDRDSLNMEDVQVVKMPLLYKAVKYLEQNPECGVTTESSIHLADKSMCPSPILFENVPQWVDFGENKKFMPVEEDKFNNIACIRPLFGKSEIYSEGNIAYLVTSLIAGFGGIQKQGQKCKKLYSIVHTGNWGCDTRLHNNNKELVYLSQMFIADAMGINEIYFHKCDEEKFKAARSKFDSLPHGMKIEDFIHYLCEQNYKRG